MKRILQNRLVRLFCVGLTLSLLSGQGSYAFEASFGLAPDNNRDLLVNAIRSAKKSLDINIYQFESRDVVQAIIKELEEGTRVRILLEGEPFGSISKQARKNYLDIYRAMMSHENSSAFYVMTGKFSDKKRRFRFNHAKYVLVDGKRTLMSSENFTSTGHPVEGYVGNRGWEVVLENQPVTQKMTEMFNQDVNTSFSDVYNLLKYEISDEKDMDVFFPQLKGLEESSEEKNSQSEPAGPKKRELPSLRSENGWVSYAELIAAPGVVERLVQLIESADDSIDLEHMTLPSLWRENGEKVLSPIVSAVVNAARRGVKVRVLLNDDRVFLPKDAVLKKPTRNEVTAAYLNRVASEEELRLEGRVVDTKNVEITYIHNKGMIVDDERVLVSSINGTRNSMLNNRETSVLLSSYDAAYYYQQAFDFDWQASSDWSFQPLVFTPITTSEQLIQYERQWLEEWVEQGFNLINWPDLNLNTGYHRKPM